MNKYFSVGLIFFLGITLSIISFWTVKHQLNIHRNLEFKWTGSEHYRAFHQQLESDINALELHKILDNFRLDKPEDFKIFSKLILNQHKSIHSLYWLPGITNNGASNHSHNKTEQQLPFLYAEPKENILLALNKDLKFIANFHKVIAQARDSGKVALSGRFSIKNGNNIQFGIIGLSPVYNKNSQQATIEQRKQNLAGFVMGLFLFNDLFNVSIGHLEPRGIDIYLLDESASGEKQILYHYKSRIPRAVDATNENIDNLLTDNMLTLKKSFTVIDHNWLFIGKATPQFRSAEAFNQGPVIALLTGIVFTVFLVLYFYNLSHTKDAWQAAEKKLHTVLDHSPDHIIILDKNNVILYINKSLFNLELSTSIGHNFFDWLPREYHIRFKKGLKKVFEEKTADFFNYSLADSSHCEVRIIPIRINNTINSAMVINTDITEQHKIQIQTMENARLASIGVLATGIAHEINNPNNSIYYNASFVQDSWKDILPVLDEYQQDNGDFSMGGLPFSETRGKITAACSSIIDHTVRIKKIVANLKSFARKNTGEINEDVDIIDVIGDALLIINNEIRKHTDQLSLDIPNKLPKVKGNAQKLEQVFINIVLNALHSLPSKDKKIQISAKYDKLQEKNIISVTDEGVGIKESRIDKITQPFYTTKRSDVGTGLGLSIASSIIKEHKGKLVIESELNKGTTVTILLPVAEDNCNHI